MSFGRLRPFRPGDGAALHTLYRQSVETLGPRHYTPAQVSAWLSIAPSADRLEALAGDGRWTVVAENAAGRIGGFADLEADGHIHFLYCAPEAAGTGCAARLLAAVEEKAVGQGLTRLHAEASEGARGAFERAGFEVLHRRDLTIGGVAIHNYAVAKPLNAAV